MEKESLEEFKVRICNNPKRKVKKVTNSFRQYDIYKYIRKNGWYNIGRPVTEHEFYTIIRSVNTLLSENIMVGEDVIFPLDMGRLELRKAHYGVKYNNGKLKVCYPVDWENTIKLWYEDKEAYEKKICVRFENKHTFYIKYNKLCAKYNNKDFYEFTPHVRVKRAMKEYIKRGETDTLW